MANKLGRNDQCACGSGKKFKKCCGVPQSSSFVEISDPEWRKIRKLEGSVIDHHLGPYTIKELPVDVIRQVLCDFCPDGSFEEIDQEFLFHDFFLPWLLFHWLPYEELELEGYNSELTISENYLKMHDKKLSNDERRFIEAMNETYYSFYSVLEVEIEEKIVVKDILLGTTHILKERQGTYTIQRGDIVFGRILTLDDQSIFVGMAPFIVSTNYHHELIDLKKLLMEENSQSELTGKFLRSEAVELIDYYFEIIEEKHNEQSPTLLNTDGDLMQYSKSYFKLMLLPEEALRRVFPLTLSDNIEEYLLNAERDESGCIIEIKFHWLKKGNKKHKHWENTVMGDVTIQKEMLILETNSEKRMQRGKKLLSKYLGDAVSFQETIIEPFEQEVDLVPEKLSENQMDNEAIVAPEVWEYIDEMKKAHWKNWFDTAIPLLDDQTPREAAKTENGREKLEALLLMYERYDSELDESMSMIRGNIPYLRSELALD